jgi:hypothetical protein
MIGEKLEEEGTVVDVNTWSSDPCKWEEGEGARGRHW